MWGNIADNIELPRLSESGFPCSGFGLSLYLFSFKYTCPITYGRSSFLGQQFYSEGRWGTCNDPLHGQRHITITISVD